MKTTTISLLLCVLLLAPAFGALESIEDHLEVGFEQIAHEFGGVQLMRESEGLAEYAVYWPENGFMSEPNHILDAYSVVLNSIKNPEKYNASNIISCNPGAKSDYFKFLPVEIGTIKIGETFTHSSPCFANNTVTLKLGSENSVILEHTVENAASWTCSDSYFYATTQNYHITNLFFKGVHRTTFNGLTDYQMKEIQRSGFKVFRVCDSLSNIFPDIFKTIMLFLGGLSANPNLPFIGSHPPFWMVSANIEFIKHATGYEWKKRANNTNTNLDAQYIKSGDFFAITRFDGLDQIIEWGAGSHAGHSAVAMWIDNELYVLESQAAWYWPRPNIQKNLYKDWLQYAENAGYQVTILPLKAEVQSKLNVSKALEWYSTVEGVPYGYHNFLFGWIDTEADSYPPVIDPNVVAPVISILEGLVSEVGIIFNEAINFRLGTSNLTVPQLAEVIDERNLTWPKVFAMPENDSWVYSDGPNMVCSSFVVALWKAGGLFDDMEIHATEFTPRDAYSLTFIDPKPVLPQACLDNDPTAQFCQVLGDYKMEFPQLSTVDPYPRMNERCPSRVQDNFYRPAGC